MNITLAALLTLVGISAAITAGASIMQSNQHVDPFYVVGISVQTTNENSQAMTDMGELWSRFFAEQVAAQIPNKAGDEIYSIYTKYESDYRGAYTAIIGCKTHSLDDVPEGYTGIKIEGGGYAVFTAQGAIPEAIVNTWQEIWRIDDQLDRAYTADYEVYGPKSQDPSNAEVEIFIAIQ